MKINQQIWVFDAPDLAVESAFWAGVLGGTVDDYSESGWHMVKVDDQPRVGIQHVADHVSPDWPDGTPQQVHLDLWVEDFESAHREVMSLGAKVLQPVDDSDPKEGYQVYADPAGHPFCLCFLKETQKGR